ncbi:hypothetical protein, partial [Moraxella catarrhalis]|uniref:hypothetical protein n=1 Tax=Moraxella catarrhalis TaxID=480 RepID=UPI001D0DAAFD
MADKRSVISKFYEKRRLQTALQRFSAFKTISTKQPNPNKPPRQKKQIFKSERGEKFRLIFNKPYPA